MQGTWGEAGHSPRCIGSHHDPQQFQPGTVCLLALNICCGDGTVSERGIPKCNRCKISCSQECLAGGSSVHSASHHVRQEETLTMITVFQYTDHRDLVVTGLMFQRNLVTDICSSSVFTESSFKCYETNEKYHPFKKYRDIFPNWHIPVDPSTQASDY
ncbi:unnamed protein product [Coregonus sp. 'balchen']|nr:unnamed protein product [Coregonus sp. 'balchen']